MSTNTNQGKRVGVWIRVSTEDQAAGESPTHHQVRARHYAEFNGWTVVEVYDLAGVSGKSVWEHPECQRMLRDVKRGHIQGLIFSKLARLARNTKELLDFSQHFETHKASLVSIEEKIDTSTPAGLLFYTMLGAIAQWEREEIASRVKSSIAVRAKLGKPLSGMAPFGYRWDDRKLVQVPEEAATRRRAFELFLEHRRKGAVARLLNAEGLRTREGKKFQDTQVGRMLRCTSAKGAYRINFFKKKLGWKMELKPESEWGTAPCVPIVSEEVFDRVNRILEEQIKPATKPGKKPVQIFTGLLKCGCGGKMYVYTGSPNYACTKCKNKIASATIEQVFVGTIADSLADGGRIAVHLNAAKQKIADRIQRAELARQQIASTKEEMRKLYELYLGGGMGVDQFKEVNIPLNERLTQLVEELPRIEGEVTALQVADLSADVIATEARSLAALWPTLDIEGKQRLASLICTGIVVPHDDPEAPIDITFTHAPGTGVSDSSSNSPNTPQGL
jgi:site-specific DNA recombinase